MKYKVELSSKAYQYLSKLDEPSKVRVFNRIKALEETPFPAGFKKLQGEKDVYRLRIGDFRILYKLLKSKETILVFRIEKMNRVYR